MSPLRSLGVVARIPRAIVIASICAVALVGAPPACAESPRWHLTIQSRPTFMQPGKATDEVQEVKVVGEKGLYVLSRRNGPNGGLIKTTITANATPAEVQRELESEMLGVGNVSVSSGQPVSDGKSYRITFVGELEAQHVGLLGTGGVNGNSPEVTTNEVVKGRPDGVIVVNAVNLGDGNASTAIGPVTIADMLPAKVKAVGIEGTVDESGGGGGQSIECSRVQLSCAFTGDPPVGET